MALETNEKVDPSRMDALAEIATLVTIEPWTLSAAHRARYATVGIDDERLLHAVALSAYFGHLNRIADAVAVPLDYDVAVLPPHADPTVAAWPSAPAMIAGAPAIDLSRRPATATALDAWVAHVTTRDDHAAIAGRVARHLGDGSAAVDLPLDSMIAALVDDVAQAPWRLSDASYAALRATGATDAMLFDIVASATTAGVVSRIRVALVALGR